MPNPSIKDEKTYREVRKSGASAEKAARDQLYQRAKKVGSPGRSNMTKGQLIDALRNH